MRKSISLSLVSLTIMLTAQTPVPKPATDSGQTPVLKVTTRLVEVNVVVHGRKNDPVDDLKREDFTIFDNKQRQQIATFSLESAKLAGEKTQKLPPLPQNTF